MSGASEESDNLTLAAAVAAAQDRRYPRTKKQRKESANYAICRYYKTMSARTRRENKRRKLKQIRDYERHVAESALNRAIDIALSRRATGSFLHDLHNARRYVTVQMQMQMQNQF